MTARNGPLAGLKVLDFSTLLPGPYASMLLADMGAKVLRVESPTRVDMLKEMAPKFDERSYAHLSINRNKQSIAIDLKSLHAKPIIEKLVQSYDIILEQFRPGVMTKLGLDYSLMKSVNPKIIYCSLTGYGQTGPLSKRAGHDINYLALSGLASYSGRQDTGPVLSATQIADIAGGSHHAVMAILAAVIERQQTKQGQYLDISMCDAALGLNALYGAAALATGDNPAAGNEVLNGGSFYDYYATKDGRYFSVGSLEPKFAIAFFSAIGYPKWAERALEKPGHQQSLKADIGGVLATKNFDEWLQIFAQADACVEPVLTVNEAANLDHFCERKMIYEVTVNDKRSKSQNIKQIASPLKFSSSSNKTIEVGAKLGQHTRGVMGELGFAQSQIDELLAQDVIYCNES